MQLVKQALKSFRRWRQGWGETADGPWQIMRRVREYSDISLVNMTEEFYWICKFSKHYGDHSPAEIALKLGQREARKRFGCDWASLMTFLDRN